MKILRARLYEAERERAGGRGGEGALVPDRRRRAVGEDPHLQLPPEPRHRPPRRAHGAQPGRGARGRPRSVLGGARGRGEAAEARGRRRRVRTLGEVLRLSTAHLERNGSPTARLDAELLHRPCPRPRPGRALHRIRAAAGRSRAGGLPRADRPPRPSASRWRTSWAGGGSAAWSWTSIGGCSCRGPRRSSSSTAAWRCSTARPARRSSTSAPARGRSRWRWRRSWTAPQVCGCDVSDDALEVARANGATARGGVEWVGPISSTRSAAAGSTWSSRTRPTSPRPRSRRSSPRCATGSRAVRRSRATSGLEVIERLVAAAAGRCSRPAARSCSRSAPARRARSAAMMEAAGLGGVERRSRPRRHRADRLGPGGMSDAGAAPARRRRSRSCRPTPSTASAAPPDRPRRAPASTR